MLVVITRIIANFAPAKNIKPIIGRWSVDYNINRINRKVDLSNEDHCGTCTSPPFEIAVVNNNSKPKPNYIHKSFNYNLTNH